MWALHRFWPILGVDGGRIIRRLIAELEVPELREGVDGVERDVGSGSSSADSLLVS